MTYLPLGNEVEGGGHFLHQQRPDEFNTLMLGCLHAMTRTKR